MSEYRSSIGISKAAHGGALSVVSVILAELATSWARSQGVEIPGGSAAAAGAIGSGLGWLLNLAKFKRSR